MHLIIIIAIGVFCGLWLFTKWAEWRAYRERKRLYEAPAKAAAAAAKAAKPAPSVGESDGAVMIVLFSVVIGLMLMAAAMHGPNLASAGVNDWITAPKLLSDTDVGFKPAPAATSQAK
jgi:Ca2+/H+ antiporter